MNALAIVRQFRLFPKICYLYVREYKNYSDISPSELCRSIATCVTGHYWIRMTPIHNLRKYYSQNYLPLRLTKFYDTVCNVCNSDSSSLRV